MNRKKITSIIKKVLKLLLDSDYQKVYKLDSRKLLSAEEIQKAVEDYTGKLTLPPPNIIKEVYIYETEDHNEVYVDIELWYEGEESDVTLSMSIINKNNEYDFSIENIHIL